MDHENGYTDKPKSYFSNERREMLDFVPKNAKNILEIGCGKGDFGALLKQQIGTAVTGIELFPSAALEARSKLDSVIEGDIETDEINLPPNQYDCLIFNDVLEHLRDPWTALAKLSKSLKPGGYVVASLPNMRHYEVFKDLLINMDWHYQDWGVLDRTHLRFFTFKTGRELFEQCGFRVLRLEGIRGTPFPWKFGAFNILMGGRLDDMRYMQFAIQAQLA